MTASDSFSAFSLSEYSEVPSEIDVTMATQTLSQTLSELDLQLRTAITPTGSSYSTKTAVGISSSDYSLYKAQKNSPPESPIWCMSNETLNINKPEICAAAESLEKVPKEVKPVHPQTAAYIQVPKQSISNTSVCTGVSNLVGSNDSEYSLIFEPKFDLNQSAETGLNLLFTDSDIDLMTCISDLDINENKIKDGEKPTEITIDETLVEFEKGNQVIEIHGKLNQVEPFKLAIELEPTSPVDVYDPKNLASSLTFSVSEIDYTHTATSIKTDEESLISSSETRSEQNVVTEKSIFLEFPSTPSTFFLFNGIQSAIDEEVNINNSTQGTMAYLNSEPGQLEAGNFYSGTLRFLQIPINFTYKIASSVIRCMVYLYESLNHLSQIMKLPEFDPNIEYNSEVDVRLMPLTEEEDQRLSELHEEHHKTQQATSISTNYTDSTNEAYVDPESTLQLQSSTSLISVFNTVNVTISSNNADIV